MHYVWLTMSDIRLKPFYVTNLMLYLAYASFPILASHCFYLCLSFRMQTDFMSGFLCLFTVSSILTVACLGSGSHWHLLAMAAVVSYSPPWWVNLLHRLPHFNFRFEQTSSDFQPDDWTYQQVITYWFLCLLSSDSRSQAMNVYDQCLFQDHFNLCVWH